LIFFFSNPFLCSSLIDFQRNNCPQIEKCCSYSCNNTIQQSTQQTNTHRRSPSKSDPKIKVASLLCCEMNPSPSEETDFPYELEDRAAPPLPSSRSCNKFQSVFNPTEHAAAGGENFRLPPLRLISCVSENQTPMREPPIHKICPHVPPSLGNCCSNWRQLH
jgi:hypothetical protein